MHNTIPPILILAFNRPDRVRVLLDKLKGMNPTKLYFAQDGPRANSKSDVHRCKEVYSVWKTTTISCQKREQIQAKNLGCKSAVSSAISWFFSQEESGIILEDDCIPDPTFFQFCDELLKRYKDTDQIMHISGNNFQPSQSSGYYFSQYPHCWGWATWARAWKHFDRDISDWEDYQSSTKFLDRFQSPLAHFFWKKTFQSVHDGAIDSWAIPWVYSIWRRDGLCILPKSNLVTNVGFGLDSTHTHDTSSPLSNRSIVPLQFPLKHPRQIIRDQRADEWDQKFVYEQRTLAQIPRRLSSIAIRALKLISDYLK